MLFTYLVWLFAIVATLSVGNYYLRHKTYWVLLKKLPGHLDWISIVFSVYTISKLYTKSNEKKYHPSVYISERIFGMSRLYEKYGMFTFWLGLKPVVTVYKAEIMELILNSSVSIEKSHEYTFLHKWLGTGLLTSTGNKWRHRRKLLTPSFHFRILEDFLPVFNQQSLTLVQKLKSMPDRKYVDISPLVTSCTLDIICETIMGVSIGAQKGKNADYVQAVHNMGDFFNKRLAYPWLWVDFLFGLTAIGRSFNRDIDTVHSFTDKVIKEKKENLLSSKNLQKTEEKDEKEYNCKIRKTFLDILLDMHVNGQQLTEADIREEVDTFMFEGHDTTALGITFALYLIGLYPDVQKKIMEEIDGIFGNDTERPATYDDTRNMKYLECTLKESQRLFPSVPMIGRKLDEDIHFREFTIPKDAMIHCSILNLHRDPKFFPNPDIFDPDRFLPENSLSRHPYSYVPFSAGPRNCIGQKFAMLEEKVVISNILRNFQVMSVDPRDKFHIKIEFTLRPAQEVRLKFIPRKE